MPSIIPLHQSSGTFISAYGFQALCDCTEIGGSVNCAIDAEESPTDGCVSSLRECGHAGLRTRGEQYLPRMH